MHVLCVSNPALAAKSNKPLLGTKLNLVEFTNLHRYCQKRFLVVTVDGGPVTTSVAL